MITSATGGTASDCVVNKKFNANTGLSVVSSIRLLIIPREWDHDVK